MRYERQDIFGLLHEEFKFDKNKPIRLFEAFAGIGCQRMALNRLLGKENVVSVGISEIDKFALMSYEAIHGDLHNYGDITKISGGGLPIIDIFTWSFPCQDLSKAGQQKGLKDTRSGLGFQVIRIIEEMKVKPKVLLMENVPDLIGSKFKKGWTYMFNEIEKLGYTNYVELLNAKDYGVAQNRNRVFMVSILGDYSYTFPKPFKLKKRLKDYLETNVDEKYFISDKLLECFTDMKDRNGFVRGERFNPHNEEKSKYAFSITTSFQPFIKVPEATKQGYSKATNGDGVYLDRPHQKRGTVQKGMIPTLKTQSKDVGVVVNQKERLRIRKLTPKECWRLMGIDDKDFEKANKVVSNAQLYKQAGNGIVVDVLEHIFKQLF